MGCKETKSKGWALRCRLEAKHHNNVAFVTLTYNEKSVPLTLDKRDLQLFIKRLRKKLSRLTPARTIRFFACGEYGENATKRPHYHALIFGASELDAQIIQEAWPLGFAKTVTANPGSINYVAGYTAKKFGDHRKQQEGIVDPETGEWIEWQPPFLQMSIKPGIGAKDRDKYPNSWRNVAIHDGQAQQVPRYLHEAWKKQATKEEKEKLDNEKAALMKQIVMTKEQRKAAEAIAISKQQLKASKRKL